MNLYIDIETIPSQRDDVYVEIASSISPPGNIKKPESISKWMEENKEAATEEQWRKTALSGTFGEIICIGWAVEDADPKVVMRGIGQSECVLLQEFFSEIKKDLCFENGAKRDPVWTGHYITGFDLRFLWQRCVINSVKPTIRIPFDAKPWDSCVFDTKVEWSGLGSHGDSSLDAVCRALGHEGKGDIDGSKVWDYAKAGRYDEIEEYCKDDVRKARILHKRMAFSI